MKKEAVANKVLRTRIIPLLRKHITDDEFHGALYAFPDSKATELIINNRGPVFHTYLDEVKYADLNSPIHERFGFESKEALLDAYRQYKLNPWNHREFMNRYRKRRRVSFPGAKVMSYLEPYANSVIRHRHNGLSRYNTLLSRKKVLNTDIFGHPELSYVYPLDLGNTFPSDYGKGAISDVISALSGRPVIETARFPMLHTFTARRPFMRTPHLADASTSRALNDYGRRTNSGASRVADAVDASRVTYKPDNANNPVEWATGRQLSKAELDALFDTNQHNNPWYEMVEDVGPHLPMYTGSYTPITEDTIKLFNAHGIDLLSKKQLPLKDIQGRTDFNLYKGTPVDSFTPVRYELSGGARLRDAIKRRLDSFNTTPSQGLEPQNGLLSQILRPFRSLWHNLTRKSLPDHPRPHSGEKRYDSEFIQQLNDPQRPLTPLPVNPPKQSKNNVIANALPEENLDVVRRWPEGDPLWFTNSVGVGAAHIKGTGVAGWKGPWVDKDFMYAALDPEDIVKITSMSRDPIVRKFNLDSLPETVINRLIKEQYRNSYDKVLRRHDRGQAVRNALRDTPQHIIDEYNFYDNLRYLGRRKANY